MSAGVICILQAALLLACSHRVLAVPLANFYSFGSAARDLSLAPTDDGSSPNISLQGTFPFFDKKHSTVFVSLVDLKLSCSVYTVHAVKRRTWPVCSRWSFTSCNGPQFRVHHGRHSCMHRWINLMYIISCIIILPLFTPDTSKHGYCSLPQ